MLPGVVLAVQFLDDAVGGVDGQALGRPGAGGIGGIKHVSQAPPLMDQLVDHDLTGAAAFFGVPQVGDGEVRLVQQAGPVPGVAAAGHPALDELQGFAGAEGE